jgi:inner membrane protein
MKVQGKNFYSLELNAIDNLTLEHIECTCPILGAWQGGLIVEYNGKSRAVGESEVNHNLFPTEALLMKGEPLRVITQRVNMNGRSLRWLVDNLQANHEYYLLGELFVDSGLLPSMNDIDLYHPVMFSGSRVRLHYAKAGDLGEYRNMVAIRGEVVVQFWLKPGDEVVELRFSGGESSAIPNILKQVF